jgi:hypothetical protein
MVEALASKGQPKGAAADRAPARRWPPFWSLLAALAASAMLWAALYAIIASASGLIAAWLSGR